MHAQSRPVPSLAALALASAAAFAASPARALDIANGKLSLNGYASVAYMRTNGNPYLFGTHEGNYDILDMALAIGATPADDVFLGAQFTLATPDEAAVDWAFGEWRPSTAFRVRIGKVKQPIGIYNEILDVGTLRPFYTLPTSVYGGSGATVEAYYGVGFTGELGEQGGWSIGYDLYGGNATMTTSEPFEALLTPGQAVGEPVEDPTRDLIGGRLILNTPVDGLNLRLSAFRGRRSDATVVVYGASAEYAIERLSLRSEVFREMELDQHSAIDAYVELGCFVTKRIQLAGRLEGSWVDLDGFTGDSSLLRHREAAIGLNYWFHPQWVVKASVHFVDGNRFAVSGPDAIADQPMPTQTRLVVVGTQFVF